MAKTDQFFALAEDPTSAMTYVSSMNLCLNYVKSERVYHCTIFL